MSTVLYTGGGGAASSALAMYGQAHFADADPDARPYGVPVDRWHSIPPASDPAFVPELAALCTKLGVDLLVPGVDEELLPLARAREQLPLLMLPPEDFVVTHLDKLASYEALSRYVAVPRTVAADRWIRPPCIVKPRRGRGSRGVTLVRNTTELHTRMALAGEDVVLQELLEGDEYTVTVVADTQGRLRAIVPVLVELKRGVTIRARTAYDPVVIGTCRRIHASNAVPGCYNVQGIKTDAGFLPFEINPRISTTACLVMAAGVDIVGAFLGRYSVEHLQSFSDVSLRRSWHNEFVGAAA